MPSKLTDRAADFTVYAALAWLITIAAAVGLATDQPGSLVGVIGGGTTASITTIAALLWKLRLRRLQRIRETARRRAEGSVG